jgi:phage baseplate assembly protein W
MKKLGDEYKSSGGSQEIYSDFLHTFLPHPSTQQITRKTNEDSVKMALRNLIFTNKYERPRNPTFGGNIRNYLFEPFTPLIENNIKRDLENLIQNYEPRVRVLEINVSALPDDNGLAISITFRTVTAPTPQQVDISLYRVR